MWVAYRLLVSKGEARVLRSRGLLENEGYSGCCLLHEEAGDCWQKPLHPPPFMTTREDASATGGQHPSFPNHLLSTAFTLSFSFSGSFLTNKGREGLCRSGMQKRTLSCRRGRGRKEGASGRRNPEFNRKREDTSERTFACHAHRQRERKREGTRIQSRLSRLLSRAKARVLRTKGLLQNEGHSGSCLSSDSSLQLSWRTGMQAGSSSSGSTE